MKESVIHFLLLLNCFAAFSQSANQKTISIPVIFHVIYSDKSHSGRIDGGNTSENIETTKILAELKDLHNDFLLLNSDTSQVITEYKNIIGNPKIEFHIADTILQQNGEKGIIRVCSHKNKWNLYKQSPVINPKKYLNVYIGNIGTSFSNSYPWNDTETDAVYLAFDWVGLHYRLLTHETGHWCGLWHIFGGSGSGKGGGCKEDGDDINDTPIQKNPTNGDCDKCPPAIEDQHCDTNKPSNYNNFMDYSGCRKMFTVEQCKRMREIITKNRPTLL